LNAEELRHLGKVLREVAAEGEHPTGLAVIRLLLLTGFRRMEALALERRWFSPKEHCIRFPDTKGGAQLRVIGHAAMECIEAQLRRHESPFVFPADWGKGHFVGVVRVVTRICEKAELDDVTPHVLRHTFASIAGDLGFSELTIAGLLGHSARGVTQGYVHLDSALVAAADQVAAEIAGLLDGDTAATRRSQSTLKQASAN
jgi:integrase